MLGPICWAIPILLGATQADLPPDWKDFVCEPGRFTVAMPMKPTDKKQVVKTATGSLNVMLWYAEGKNDALFAVSYCDFTEADVKKATIAKRLDQARDGAVESARGTLKSEKAIELEGHPGRELVIEKDKEIIARTRIFLVKNRLYQVMALGSVPAKEASSFLESFRLNK